MRRFVPAGALLVAALVLVSCGSSTPKVSATVLLQKAKATADAAHSVHFAITSSNVSLNNTNLIGGQGDLVRPSSLQGTFKVAISGFTASVKVISVGDEFFAELPFTGHYIKTDPASLGLKNPNVLLDPETGLTSLLTLAQSPTLGPVQRRGGELLATVSYLVPGSAVPVIPDDNPSQPVHVTVAINPKTFELRTITLVGPFTSATSNSTYVVTLTDYNEPVDITLPPAS